MLANMVYLGNHGIDFFASLEVYTVPVSSSLQVLSIGKKRGKQAERQLEDSLALHATLALTSPGYTGFLPSMPVLPVMFGYEFVLPIQHSTHVR
jgi:hypothetical protein